MSNVLSLSSCVPPFLDFSKILIALLTFPFSISQANVVASFLLFVEALISVLQSFVNRFAFKHKFIYLSIFP